MRERCERAHGGVGQDGEAGELLRFELPVLVERVPRPQREAAPAPRSSGGGVRADRRLRHGATHGSADLSRTVLRVAGQSGFVGHRSTVAVVAVRAEMEVRRGMGLRDRA